jgi:hypothetical protein
MSDTPKLWDDTVPYGIGSAHGSRLRQIARLNCRTRAIRRCDWHRKVNILPQVNGLGLRLHSWDDSEGRRASDGASAPGRSVCKAGGESRLDDMMACRPDESGFDLKRTIGNSRRRCYPRRGLQASGWRRGGLGDAVGIPA